MPRLPIRIQGSPYGSSNPTGPSAPVMTPSIRQPGPAQSRENFSNSVKDPVVARALNDLQSKIASAVQQSKADPTADKNIVENLPITQGGPTGGLPPYNFIEHQLGFAFRGYRICDVTNGQLEGHAKVGQTGTVQPYPPTTHLALWTKFIQWGSQPVQITIEIW